MNKRLLRVYEAISDDKPISKEDAKWLFDEHYKYSDALIDRVVLGNGININRERIVRLIGKYFVIIKRENEYEARELEADVVFIEKFKPDDY